MSYSLLETKTIEELCSIIDCEHRTPSYISKSEYLVVRTINIRNGQLTMENMKYTTIGDYKKWTSRAIPESGDILFTREAPVGNSCIVPNNIKICMGQRLVLLRPKQSETDSIFLSTILNSERTKSDIRRFLVGSTVSRINIQDIKKIRVIMPPLKEQKKIVEILSVWTKAIRVTELLIKNNRNQKKAFFQIIFKGDKRLSYNSHTRFKRKWKKIRLGDCINHKAGRALEKYVKDEAFYRFISIGNYSADGKYIDDGKRIELNRNTESGVLKKNDLVMILNDKTKYGNIIGSTILINESDRYIYNQRSVKILCKNGFDSTFFWHLLNSNHIRHNIFKKAQGDTQIHVNFTDLKSIELNIPEEIEQKKIALVLSCVDKELNALEKQLTYLKKEKDALLQQVLTGNRKLNN